MIITPCDQDYDGQYGTTKKLQKCTRIQCLQYANPGVQGGGLVERMKKNETNKKGKDNCRNCHLVRNW